MSKELDEKARQALAALGHTEEEIAELAEKQKALPEEENVVEKEDKATLAEKLYAAVGKVLGIAEKEGAPDASVPDEARKTDEVTEPATTAEPAETKQAGGESQEQEPNSIFQELGATIAKMVQDQLAERDKRIVALEAQIADMNQSVEEKVAQRLADVPPVVKVAASMVEATAVDEVAPKGLTFGQQPPDMGQFKKELVTDIKRLVETQGKGAGFTV